MMTYVAAAYMRHLTSMSKSDVHSLPKTVRSTSKFFYHLIGFAEMYLNEYED